MPKLEYYYVNNDSGEELMVEAESFEIAEALMFHQGDEHDLDPKEWELDRTEECDEDDD